MALLQKQPQADLKPLYTLGLNSTLLLVGLGNPGKKYDGTRHNVGFYCLDEFVKSSGFGTWTEKKDLRCLLASGALGDTRVIAIKPMTFMNLSGEAVSAVMRFYKVPTDKAVVVHDEIDIPFGLVRTRIGGSSAGHKGIKSLLAYVGDNFGRIRIGIKRETRMEASDFVLAKFSPAEQKHLPALAQEVTAILTEYVFSGQLPAETRSFIV